jgi:hypothetical protein
MHADESSDAKKACTSPCDTRSEAAGATCSAFVIATVGNVTQA